MDTPYARTAYASIQQAFPQTLFDAVQEAVQHGVLQLGIVEMVA